MPSILVRAIAYLSLGTLAACGAAQRDEQAASTDTGSRRAPNLVIFYVDDLGFGDVGSYGASGVETPNIDQLAENGVRFTDAHSSAATCTPSRYSLLTGEHGFRSNAEILPGDAPALIRPGKPTLASMLKRAGYATAVIGKWHLGLGDGSVNWNEDVAPGPLEIGFDYSFLLPATGDRVPTVYLENHRVVNLDPTDPIEVSYKHKVGNRPTGYEHPELLRFKADRQHSDTIVNGVSRIGHMGGGESALWIDEEFPDVFTQKAIAFIRDNRDRPFFLFQSFHDIHVPRLPNARFQGKSTMGPRGDSIAQADWIVGTVVNELQQLGIAENTLIVFTSDNGPVLDDGYADQAAERLGNHKPAGPYRGGKYSSFEAGTRVPTIVSWPGTVNPGVSDALLSQLDIYASMASIAGVELDAGEARDSLDLADTLLGHSEHGRELLLEESVGGLSLRRRNWKYIVPFSGKTLPDWLPDKGIEGGISTDPQLFNLDTDIGEQQNVAADNTDRIAEMQALVEQIVATSY